MSQLEAEVTRAKNRENELASQIKIVNDNLVKSKQRKVLREYW